MRKIVAILFALVMLITLACPVSASSFNQESCESVAVVSTWLETDTEEQSLGFGSGFFVGEKGVDPTYLITNYHVISDFIDYHSGELFDINVDGTQITGRSKIRVYFDSSEYAEAYLVSSDKVKDVAILRLEGPTDKRKPIPLRIPGSDMVGASVYAVGYPGLSDNVFVSATSTWGLGDASVTGGVCSRLFTTEGTGMKHIQIDCVIRPGNSGGPLVDATGAAIGINTFSVSDGANEIIYYAVNIEEAIMLLNANGIAYEMAAEEKDMAWIAAIGAAALVAVVIAVFAAKKKKVRKAPASVEVRPAAAAATVRSHAVQHGGQRFILTNQTVIIGRNPGECYICYQNETPGVSSRHCSLAWNAETKEFMLTDLNSTYGTYLANGQKLTPGVGYSLRSGDSFYLGQQSNQLTVEVV